jgi:putative flavoprotein involved in K+ transport
VNGEMNGPGSEPNTLSQSSDDVEVAVIGAGQAGLAMGSFLRRQGCRFVMLDRGPEIAPAWRERWDSLTLFTPRRYSAAGPSLSWRSGRLPDAG